MAGPPISRHQRFEQHRADAGREHAADFEFDQRLLIVVVIGRSEHRPEPLCDRPAHTRGGVSHQLQNHRGDVEQVVSRLSAPDSAPLIAERTNRIIWPGFLTDQLENPPVEVLHSRHLQRPVLAKRGLLGNRSSVSLMEART